MASLNRIQIIGNLGGDPEMRFTPNGNPVTNFSVATTRKYTVDDEPREETQWFRVTTWNKLAETCNQFLVKGKQVYVEGWLKTREWEDKEGGKRFSVEITANTVLFLGQKQISSEDTQPTEAAKDFTPGELEPEDIPF